VIRRIGLALAVVALLGAPGAVAAPQRLVHFQSPSGNINCILDVTFASCLVKRHTWRNLPARPPSCDTDWIPSEVSLGRRSVSAGVCRGDVGPLCVPNTSLRCTTLAYGRSVVRGAIRCSSAVNGVTCRRRDGRRIGFRVAREGYTLFR
jgi:hypothetical protein